MSKADLAVFLRRRRAALSPPSEARMERRRTPGLRREEVAARASMSVEYYTRLEQARGATPSARMLDALGDALQLNPADRARLFALAGSAPTAPRRLTRQVSSQMAGLLERMPLTAAIVTAASYEVIAANALAQSLLPGLALQANLARRYFLQGRHWTSAADDFAEVAVARLRSAATRYPADPELAALVAELRAGSEAFRALWAADPTRMPGHRVKVVDHPVAGRLTVNCNVLLSPEDDQQIVLITAEPGTADEQALRALAAGLSHVAR